MPPTCRPHRISGTYDLPGDKEVLTVADWFHQYSTPAQAAGIAPAVAGMRVSTTPNRVASLGAVYTGTYGSYTAASTQPTTEFRLPIAWNLTIDQQLPWNSLLDVAYVGSSSSQMDNDGESSNGSAFPALADQNKTPIGALFCTDPADRNNLATNPENVSATPTAPNCQQICRLSPVWVCLRNQSGRLCTSRPSFRTTTLYRRRGQNEPADSSSTSTSLGRSNWEPRHSRSIPSLPARTTEC